MNERDISKAIVELTQALIRFQTTPSHPGELNRCADFIGTWLQNQDIRYQRIQSQGVPSFLVLPASGFAPVLLMSHIDVVEGPDALFVPRIEGEKLYGRGSLDDKYAVALSLILFQNNLRRVREKGGDQSWMPFGLMITGDEETGGENGAKVALKQVNTRFGIVLDGGDLSQIVVKEKGIARLKLSATGKSAHGARPWLGENAIEKLMGDYRQIQRFFPCFSDPDHWHRSLNLGWIRGGKSVNQVPDFAEALLDIRFIETDDIAALTEAMAGAVSGELTVQAIHPVFDGGDSPHLDLLLRIAKKSRLAYEDGGSDARFLSARGIAGIVWGADGGRSHHSPDEHVHIPSLSELYRILDAFLNRATSI